MVAAHQNRPVGHLNNSPRAYPMRVDCAPVSILGRPPGSGGVTRLQPSAAGPLLPRMRLFARVLMSLVVGWLIGGIAHATQPGWWPGPLWALIAFMTMASGILRRVLHLVVRVLASIILFSL